MVILFSKYILTNLLIYFPQIHHFVVLLKLFFNIHPEW